MHGRSLIDMCAAFQRLITICVQRDLKPIITTLAPLANSNQTPETQNNLLLFNSFLLNKYESQYPIIDIWSQMVNPYGQIELECFEW